LRPVPTRLCRIHASRSPRLDKAASRAAERRQARCFKLQIGRPKV
jgi:hypothetical protein